MGFSFGWNSFGKSIMRKLFDLISAIVSVLYSRGYLKSIAAILIFSSFCLAQQRNTVFLLLAQNLTTTGNVTYLVNNNIGQNFHTFVIYASQSSSCTSGILANYQYNTAAQIEGSYDGTIFNQIPQVKISFSYDSVNNTAGKYYRAAGAYPYIRIRLLNIVSTCSSNIGYTGLLQANPLTDASSPLIVESYVGSTCTLILPAALSGYNLNGVTILNADTAGTATGSVGIFSDSSCSVGSFISGFYIGTNIAPDPSNSSLGYISPNNSGVYAKGSTTPAGDGYAFFWFSLVY